MLNARAMDKSCSDRTTHRFVSGYGPAELKHAAHAQTTNALLPKRRENQKGGCSVETRARWTKSCGERTTHMYASGFAPVRTLQR